MVCSFFIPKMKGVRKIATTGIWKIEKRLDNVIDYTTNIEKTINSDYGKDSYYDLHNVIDYVEADYKTEKQFYVSGVNCNPKTALEEMTITKEQYGKTGGNTWLSRLSVICRGRSYSGTMSRYWSKTCRRNVGR